jgi:mono/diheme cytochrome c family protein
MRALSMVVVSLLARISVADGPLESTRTEEGARIFMRACAPCHGDLGDGRSPAARVLEPPPRDFSSGVYKFRSTAWGNLPLPEDLMRTIARGIPGTAMPSFREHLNEEEQRLVATFILSLAAGSAAASPAERVVAPAETLAPPDATRQRVDDGRRLFQAIGCVQCHGAEGRGDGPAAKGLKDERGHKAVMPDFARDAFRGGSSPQDIYRTLVTGVGGTPMPAFGDALPDDTARWNLVLYLRSLVVKPGFWEYLFGPQTSWR